MICQHFNKNFKISLITFVDKNEKTLVTREKKTPTIRNNDFAINE